MKHTGMIGLIGIFIIITAMIFWTSPWQSQTSSMKDSPTWDPSSYKYVSFAGGCFWCMEGIFEAQQWVIEARVWYIGGAKETANYTAVSSGNTKHREWVRVTYDPNEIDFATLLELFWTQIDPTDPDGQFADRGYHYTTAIYYDGDEEKMFAQISKDKLQNSWKFETDIATLILPLTEFFEAESYHQDYYKKSALRYKLYKKWSGREDFIEQNWKDRITEINEQTYSEDALRARLTPLQYEVTQNDATERAFDNEYWDNKDQGIYVDIIDGTALYSSLNKYDSGTGWPSFSRAIDDDVITRHVDTRLFRERIEARSSSSDAHLWHIFNDGPIEQGGKRHCLNSASLRFVPLESLEEEGYGEYLELF